MITFALALCSISPLSQADNCFEQLSRNSGTQELPKEIVTRGLPIPPTSGQGKALQDIIDFIKDVDECISGADPTNNPPTGPFGGITPSGLSPGDQLQILADTGKICLDEKYMGDGVIAKTSALLDTVNDGMPHTIGLTEYWSYNTGGINFSSFPSGDDAAEIATMLPAGMTVASLDGWSSVGGCAYDAGKFISAAGTLLHELQHINDDLGDMTATLGEVEGEAYRNQSDFLCDLLECAGDPTTNIDQESRDMTESAEGSMCNEIIELNLGVCTHACVGSGDCPECDDSTSTNCYVKPGDEPDEGDEGGNSSSGSGRRYGYFHTCDQISHILYSKTARLSMGTFEVRFTCISTAHNTVAGITDNASFVSLPSTSGYFVPVSVEGVGNTDFYVFGYDSETGDGAVIKYVVTGNGFPGNAFAASSPALVYYGDRFTYPVAVAHREATSLLYVLDGYSGDIVGLSTVNDATFTILSGQAHPDTQGKYALQIAEYGIQGSYATYGFKLSASTLPPSSVSPDTGLGQEYYHMSDTDRNGRFDLFRVE